MMCSLPGWSKVSLIVTLALITGIGIGLLLIENGGSNSTIWPWSSDNTEAGSLYSSNDNALIQHVQSSSVIQLGWKALMPQDEAALMEKYQPDKSKPLSDQVFQSLQASFDSQYQSMQTSMNTVQGLNNKPVAMNGFIVPVDVNDSREILSFFLVPYFGACIHFPPPAPNQMVYVRTPEGFTLDGSSDAYTVTGLLQVAMFEDPMGTSAYLMDAVDIKPFSGKPDDVRDHELQTY